MDTIKALRMARTHRRVSSEPADLSKLKSSSEPPIRRVRKLSAYSSLHSVFSPGTGGGGLRWGWGGVVVGVGMESSGGGGVTLNWVLSISTV